MTTLGFLGLGSMGAGMAARLVDAGYDVVVWNRSEGAARPLVAVGARRASGIREALSTDVSFSMLANDAAVEAVLDESATAALAGRTHVVMASISPALADRLADAFERAGSVYVAAPVLGRPAAAAAGRLDILAAGPATALDALDAFFRVLGTRTWRLGSRPSVANAVKVVVNYNIAHALQAIGESVAMIERRGVEPALFTELLASTLFGGVVHTGYGDLIARGAYTPPGFRMALGRKDLGLVEEVARSAGVNPVTLAPLVEVFERALAEPELRDCDWSAIAEVTRRGLL
ncbi:NAD(P)-dependent oxidoreductase [Streptomyces sp. NPDC091281]|uniref:NAD(P)-dependent oxidoreductase n=1 Tax=Streptomyces sp. NPDC091281 TaxID=3365985 RepID=UPI003826B90C